MNVEELELTLEGLDQTFEGDDPIPGFRWTGADGLFDRSRIAIRGLMIENEELISEFRETHNDLINARGMVKILRKELAIKNIAWP